MSSFWLFRTNLPNFEYYHDFVKLEEFKKKCHDFYLLMALYFLEKDYFDEVIIWRLANSEIPDIVFDVNGKLFIQRWIRDFRKTSKLRRPEISFFRGGFKEYCTITKENPKFYNKKIYLGAGNRVFPQYGGKYDVILIEDERDTKRSFNCLPFYKTANPNIFFPIGSNKKYDLCWIANFTQLRYKGHEFFLNAISKSNYLKSLKIVHLGNQPEVGEKFSKEKGITNIEFLGWKQRPFVNSVLNNSKAALVTSNRNDGCPRVITEILMSGTPLLLRSSTRCLSYYKGVENGTVVYEDNNLEKAVREVLTNNYRIRQNLENRISSVFSFEEMCERNLSLWLRRK